MLSFVGRLALLLSLAAASELENNCEAPSLLQSKGLVDRAIAAISEEEDFEVDCHYEVNDVDYGHDTPDHDGEAEGDGYVFGTCRNHEDGMLYYLHDGEETADFGSGDELRLVLRAMTPPEHGKDRGTPPWEREKAGYYMVVGVKKRTAASVLEAERREKYGLTQQLTSETKEMDILMVICNYRDYKVDYYRDEQHVMDLLYEKGHDGDDVSFDEGLRLSTMGRLSAPKSRGKVVTVDMEKNLSSITSAEGPCPAADCRDTALKLIPKQHPDVDPGSFTFREFFVPNQLGVCGWAGLAVVGCGHYSKIPNPGGCWALYRYNYGGLIRGHELAHNLGLGHNRQAYPMHEAGRGAGSDPQSILTGVFTWNRAAVYQIGALRMAEPDVYTWTMEDPRQVISLGSMTLPFAETGAETASIRVRCPCCEAVGGSSHGGDVWLQYRGTTGLFGGVSNFYKGKVFVHNAHAVRGIVEMWAYLLPGETYRVPDSSIYVHYCPEENAALARIAFGFSPYEARGRCPGAQTLAADMQVRMASDKELGFPGIVCDFPFTYQGVEQKDCFAVEGKEGSWCVSGRHYTVAPCNEEMEGRGRNYLGCQNKTRSGRTCQSWASSTPHSHRFGGEGEHNYCRNPDNEPSIWCYTTDPGKRWEYCSSIPSGPKLLSCAKPTVPPQPDAAPGAPPPGCGSCDETMIGNGRTYKGCQNKTRSGRTCQRWDSSSPHRHGMSSVGAHNSCRNPDGEPSIWCYTTDPAKRWELCDPVCEVPEPVGMPVCSVTDGSAKSSRYPCHCGEALCREGRVCSAATNSCAKMCEEGFTGNGRDYKGCQNKTRSGRTCQSWSAKVPHSHRFGGQGPHNYCRNPDGEPSMWCYTTDPAKRWELCDALPASNPPHTMPESVNDPDKCFPVPR